MSSGQPTEMIPSAARTLSGDGAHASESLGMLALRLRGDLASEGRGRCVLLAGADDDAAGLETTLELAWCLAQDLGHSVLLIDGAFGSQGLDAALGLDGQAGLADYLDAPTDEDAVLARLEQATAHALVTVLPQGPAGGARTVRAKRLHQLLEQARQRHEFVLVRSSLQTDVNRSLAFCAEVDAALLLAVEEQTTWDQITRGQRLLNDCGASRVALVLADRWPARRSKRL